MNRFLLIILLFVSLSNGALQAQQQRFPKPEFETGYEQPSTTTPEPRSLALEWLDVALLLLILGITSYVALRKRSRNIILILSIFTLLYFGFYRNGCICPVGSLQNVAFSLFNSEYSVSITVLIFFLVPLVFTLFFGRIFCASACPLGVIQDLLIIKPYSIPKWLQKVLGLFPIFYLSLAILYAATGTDFIICRYDPFVGIYRLGAAFNMIVLGVCILLIGLFVARPYCRFICPYGVLLKWTSIFSWKHLSITPAECIQCKLCTNSCPFDAINHPSDDKEVRKATQGTGRFLLFAVLIPVWVFIGGFVLSQAHPYLSKAHSDVHLAELLVFNPDLINNTDNLDIKTFMASGKSLEKLVFDAKEIQNRFKIAGWYIGGFLGLVLGLSLLNQQVYRRRVDYEPDKGDCFSCGRCFSYCPVKK